VNARIPYFLGSGLHSCLGDSTDKSVAALRQPAEPPKIIECNVFDDVEAIPYKLLQGAVWERPDKRIYHVINNVVQQAIDEAGLSPSEQQNMALFVGSSSFDISVSEYLYQQELQRDGDAALALRLSSFGNVAAYIRDRFSIRGADYSFNTACTASANALLTAADMIRLGLIEHALVVGVELYNDITAQGFHGLNLLTRSVMKPFDRERDGLVLGESCSALVLGCNKSQAPVAHPFSVSGGANRCDTFSISAANPDGSTVAEVITLAMENANVTASDINAIKVHGTASLSNDESEAAGMRSVFDIMPTACALKPFVGHTLGACGLSELILFFSSIEQGFLPATPGIGVGDSGLGIELNQHYHHPGEGHFLLNYFGFGGNNSSLVITNAQ
jgi:3-oxoacyl-[acyl-carrier-protein] synthase I